METLEEKVKRLEEENLKLLNEVEDGDKLIKDLMNRHKELKRNNRKLNEEKKELLEALKMIYNSNIIGKDLEIEELIKKHEK